MHEHVTMLLSEQITTMAILPGEVLRESQLAEALEVSRTPIRQALTTLESMDFIQFVPGKGYVVSVIDWYSYREWIVIRRAIEPSAAELAAERITPDEYMELKEAVRSMRQYDFTRVFKNMELFSKLESDFHQKVCLASKNKYLIEAYEQIAHQLQRAQYYFVYSNCFNLEVPVSPEWVRDNRDMYENHAIVLRAIRMGNSGMAYDAMLHHFDFAFRGTGGSGYKGARLTLSEKWRTAIT